MYVNDSRVKRFTTDIDSFSILRNGHIAAFTDANNGLSLRYHDAVFNDFLLALRVPHGDDAATSEGNNISRFIGGNA